jgi:hypothetical protein
MSETIAQPRGHWVLGPAPTVHESCRVRDAELGAWTALGPNTTIAEATFGDYSYTAGDVSIIYADVGKFCSIASHARINPGNHPMWRVTQHHMTYRRRQYRLAEGDDEDSSSGGAPTGCGSGTTSGSATARSCCPGSRSARAP